MAIEKMSLVNIAGLMDELDATLKRCCESGCFHIEPAGNSPDSAMKPLSEKNEYDRPLKELAQLSAQLGITLKETDFTDCDLSAPQDFNSLFEKYNIPFSELNTKRLELTQRISELGGAVRQIDHLKGMHSDFQQLFSMKYVSVRIGKLPVDNLPIITRISSLSPLKREKASAGECISSLNVINSVLMISSTQCILKGYGYRPMYQATQTKPWKS